MDDRERATQREMIAALELCRDVLGFVIDIDEAAPEGIKEAYDAARDALIKARAL